MALKRNILWSQMPKYFWSILIYDSIHWKDMALMTVLPALENNHLDITRSVTITFRVFKEINRYSLLK